jgi:hypothetical protein
MISEPTSEKGYPSFEAVNQQTRQDQWLIDQVLDQIAQDVERGDLTALEQLLKGCERGDLESYLPEEQWQRFTDSK